MKHLILLLLMVSTLWTAKAQSGSGNTAAIRQEMAKIRQSTNWEDPLAAQKANEQIRELAKKLLLTGQSAAPTSISNEKKEELAEEKMQIIDQMLKSARQGENADILLAEPLRKKIVEAYQEDESPKNIHPEFFRQMSVLVIDMSSKMVQYTIDQMKNYTGIKTLIITGGETGAVVNLSLLLSKAENYPLQQLYIINFKNYLSNLPPQIGKFKNLNTLALYNNDLKELPASLGLISGMDSLYVDRNPIASLQTVVGNYKGLKKLGVAKTAIPNAELIKIKQLLPNCQIMNQ